MKARGCLRSSIRNVSGYKQQSVKQLLSSDSLPSRGSVLSVAKLRRHHANYGSKDFGGRVKIMVKRSIFIRVIVMR